MLLPDWAVLDALIDWMGHGLFNLAWWQVLLITLGTVSYTHLTLPTKRIV